MNEQTTPPGGNRPADGLYRCNACSAAFPVRPALYQHKKTEHGWVRKASASSPSPGGAQLTASEELLALRKQMSLKLQEVESQRDSLQRQVLACDDLINHYKKIL